MSKIVCALLLALACAACRSEERALSSAGNDVAALGIKNMAVTPDGKLLTAGQLTEAQFEALPALGFDTLISLREPTEDGAGWEEEFAKAHGIEFVRIPMSGAEGLTRDNAQKLDAAIRSAAHGAAVYCGSSNRVGGLLALKAHFVDGVPADQALEYGKKCGLTRLEDATRKALADQ